MACVEMKESHERWHLQVFISIAMYPANRSYNEQGFNIMSEENEKKTIVKKSL